MRIKKSNLKLMKRNPSFCFLFSKFWIFSLLSIFYFLFSVSSVLATTLFFEPEEQLFSVGDVFEISLMLFPEGESVNALEGVILFTHDKLFLMDIRDGGSIIDLWMEQPTETDEGILFSGIIPGGFKGIQEPFNSDLKPGTIITLVFKAHEVGKVTVEIKNPQVLLHDGEGTSVKVKTKNLEFRILDLEEEKLNSLMPLVDSGEEKLQILDRKDTQSPELFELTIIRDPDLHDNKWVVLFATQDTDSGIDYYEVYESRKKYNPTTIINKNISWQRTESPYVLVDQTLSSYVFVKAIDNDGNIRIAYTEPENKILVDKFFTLSGIIILLSLFILLFFFRRKKYLK